MEAMQNTAAPNKSLNEYLHEQWTFIECEETIQKIGTAIIDNIDEAGYLRVDSNSVRETMRTPVKPEQVEEALALVQTLEPAGVGARNLTECMLLQLRNSEENRSLEIELVVNHLKDLEMNRYPAVAHKTGRSIAEIKKAVEVISHVDRRPGLTIGRHEVPYVIPDVIMDYDEENDIFTARLSEGNNPSMRINRMYLEMMKQENLTAEAKEFLQNNVRSARWLIEAIEQRKHTLLRVVNHVLANQGDFFRRGSQHLRPLPMVEVAEVLGIHVGTVSRAVSGKYLQAPSGKGVSWDAIKAKLQEIIDREDKKNPYNDDELMEELAKVGLNVARRTVAKYRAVMHIPPARRRKQFE
jgi:RNA polymerase sigma-54 factor